MSVHFISGKPGGGKTLYSVRLIVEELVLGSRTIVTNVPLKFDALNAYLQKHYPRQYAEKFEFSYEGIAPDKILEAKEAWAAGGHHITDRIITISDEEMSHFFTFRGNGVRLKSVTNEEWRNGVRPDFSPVKDQGVFYVLDEIHIAFNSRAWALTGNEVLYYLSQHRKLGDDVVCVTQSIGNVDKQFRSVAQDYTYIRNLSKQRAGWFRMPAMFMRSTYAQPATENSKAMETGSFRLDVTGLASLYDTAKGVGIHGRSGADKKARKKGISWIWFIVGFPLIIWWLVTHLPLLLAHSIFPAPKLPPVVPHASIPAFVSPVAAIVPGVIAERSSVVVVTQFVDRVAVPDVLDSVFCVGYSANGRGGFNVFLSDGDVVTTDSGRIAQIGHGWVIVDGKKLRIHAPAAVPAKNTSGEDYRDRPLPMSAPSSIYVPVPVQIQ